MSEVGASLAKELFDTTWENSIWLDNVENIELVERAVELGFAAGQKRKEKEVNELVENLILNMPDENSEMNYFRRDSLLDLKMRLQGGEKKDE